MDRLPVYCLSSHNPDPVLASICKPVRGKKTVKIFDLDQKDYVDLSVQEYQVDFDKLKSLNEDFVEKFFSYTELPCASEAGDASSDSKAVDAKFVNTFRVVFGQQVSNIKELSANPKPSLQLELAEYSENPRLYDLVFHPELLLFSQQGQSIYMKKCTVYELDLAYAPAYRLVNPSLSTALQATNVISYMRLNMQKYVLDMAVSHYAGKELPLFFKLEGGAGEQALFGDKIARLHADIESKMQRIVNSTTQEYMNSFNMSYSYGVLLFAQLVPWFKFIVGFTIWNVARSKSTGFKATVRHYAKVYFGVYCFQYFQKSWNIYQKNAFHKKLKDHVEYLKKKNAVYSMAIILGWLQSALVGGLILLGLLWLVSFIGGMSAWQALLLLNAPAKEVLFGLGFSLSFTLFFSDQGLSSTTQSIELLFMSFMIALKDIVACSLIMFASFSKCITIPTDLVREMIVSKAFWQRTQEKGDYSLNVRFFNYGGGVDIGLTVLDSILLIISSLYFSQFLFYGIYTISALVMGKMFICSWGQIAVFKLYQHAKTLSVNISYPTRHVGKGLPLKEVTLEGCEFIA